MRPLSVERQNSIISLLTGGMSQKQVAHRLGMSMMTVCKYQKARLPGLQVSKDGRVAKLTAHDKRQLRRNVFDVSWTTATEAHVGLHRDGIDVSATTVPHHQGTASMRDGQVQVVGLDRVARPFPVITASVRAPNVNFSFITKNDALPIVLGPVFVRQGPLVAYLAVVGGKERLLGLWLCFRAHGP
jgi:transposase